MPINDEHDHEEANKAAAAAHEKNQKAVEQDHNDRMKKMSEDRAKAQRDMDTAQPTPTQEENDRAKLGLQKPDQEKAGNKGRQGDDRSVSYQTRDAAPTNARVEPAKLGK